MTKVDAPLRIEARGLVKEYPGVRALDGANLTVEGGSIHGLLGKNGAGKSTIIKVLAGAVHPDGGEILVDGEPTTINNPHAAKALGFAFAHQELMDVPNLTVAENVLLGLGYPTVAGSLVRTRAMRKRAAEALDRLEADIDPAAPLESLGVAERRLVVIAHGLAAEARMIVLDEPTASLTDSEIEHLDKVLRSLRSDGVAIVYVSHRLEEIFNLTDEVTVFRDGRTVFEGKTAEMSRSDLITRITGDSVATAVEERTPHVTLPDAPELMRVEGMSLPGVVEDVSFVLRQGEMLGIAGLVGSGRTELMRLIFGADKPAAGEVWLHGEKLKIRSPRDGIEAGIVLLPEDRKGHGGVFNFSVRKNITLPQMTKFRLTKPIPVPSSRRERNTAKDLVERLEIKVPDVEHPARYLSGGNQQKMVLAKWLDSGADVFIFDEPTQGIDVGGKEEVYRLMTGLAEAGKGVIFISSEFNELVGTCGRVLVMREGWMVSEFEGTLINEEALVGACYEHEASPNGA
ncbi:MAG: sugar ABC transporter ATP-binding protein [Solirubrobacterales bacterium]